MNHFRRLFVCWDKEHGDSLAFLFVVCRSLAFRAAGFFAEAHRQTLTLGQLPHAGRLTTSAIGTSSFPPSFTVKVSECELLWWLHA